MEKKTKKKILVVEDEPDMVAIYKLALERKGFEVGVATTREEGLKKIKEVKPDLIFLDIVLDREEPTRPEKMYAGFYLLEDMKKDPTIRNIPVVISTALGGKEIEDRGRKLGVIGCLRKTDFSPSQIAERLEKILKKC